MAEVAVGKVDSVLAEVRELAQSLIAPAAAEVELADVVGPDRVAVDQPGRGGAVGRGRRDSHGQAGQPLRAVTRSGRALTLMAARSDQPSDLSEASAHVRALMQTMERNRLRRLQACGFDGATARHLSDLHTPNLM
jgi:hypothetical protein